MFGEFEIFLLGTDFPNARGLALGEIRSKQFVILFVPPFKDCSVLPGWHYIT